jgi:hypothetical protein
MQISIMIVFQLQDIIYSFYLKPFSNASCPYISHVFELYFAPVWC